MARYKPVNYVQDKFIPVSFEKQILPGTFEHTLSYLIDCELDMSVFDSLYHNDETGAPAYDPSILLKIILFGYSRGITSSRELERACRENVVFMALSADTQPHFTTIASFISGMSEQIVPLFRDVLLVCDELDLLGGDMLAIDGCKMSSNASKHWSGTKDELKSKMEKFEHAAMRLLEKHKSEDGQTEGEQREREEKAIKRLKGKAKKIKNWLAENEEKVGKRNKPLKSNVTDNDSAKMGTNKGILQGYCGVSAVDSQHQIVIYSEAFGQGPENDLLEPMLEGVKAMYTDLGAPDRLRETKVTADSGFYSQGSVAYVNNQGIDAYLPDGNFRKRDSRFSEVEKYKTRSRKEKQRREGREAQVQYTNDQFIHDQERHKMICPAGKALYSSGTGVNKQGIVTYRFKGAKRDCVPCSHRSQCLRNPEKTQVRQVSLFKSKEPSAERREIDQMQAKVDTAHGKHQYSRRMGIVEPVFGNITATLGLDHFSLRGREKVTIQWKLYTMVHNLLKIHRYGQWDECVAT